MSGAAQAWFIAGTIPLIVAGTMHVVAALVDIVRPTFFAPIERSIKPTVDGTGIRLIGKPAPSMWRVWLGVHITHGLGIVAVALLCLLIAIDDPNVVEQIEVIRPLAIAFSAALLAVSLRFFFWGPMLITGSATACFIVATVLSA